MTKPFIIYTLHLSSPVGRQQHYTGITRAERLMERMREHGHGRGASLTRKAVAKGISLTLVSTLPADSPADERTIKNRGHAKTRCVLCSGFIVMRQQGSTEVLLPSLPEKAFQPVEY